MGRTLARGVMLIEIIVALGIAAVAAVGIIQISKDQDERSRAAIVARHMLTVGDAMQRYINDQYATLITVATDTVPAVVTVNTLITSGYLPSGTSVTDLSGNALCSLVLRTGVSPAPVQLQALLVSEGPASFDDLSLARVVTNLGAAGGAIYSGTPLAISGVYGNWTIHLSTAGTPPAPSPFLNSATRCDGSTGPVQLTAGHYMMALWYGKTFNNEDVLYRKQISGRPDLNTMATPLGLFHDTSGKTGYGAACAQVGQVAVDATGAMLTCKLDDAGTNQLWGNYYAPLGAGVTFGSACNTNGAFGKDASGQELYCQGNTWGKFLSSSASIVFADACSAPGAYGRNAAGQLLNCKDGYWILSIPSTQTSGPFIVFEGGACPSNGALATDAAGTPFICKASIWTALSRNDGYHMVQFNTLPVNGWQYWTVPAGVKSLLLTMVGGGESGGYTGPDVNNVLVHTWPGGSGGYVQDVPIKVTPGETLRIYVGRGGPTQNTPAGLGPSTAPGNPGESSAVYHADNTFHECTGGGSPTSPWAGGIGRCTLEPYGGAPGRLTLLYGSGNPGGITPMIYGSGGSAGRCWGTCPPIHGGAGSPGWDGVVVFKYQ